MSTLAHLLLWIAAMGLALALATGLVARWAWRRLRRFLTQTLGRAGALRFAAPGPGRDVAQARRDLRAEVASASRAVLEGQRGGRPVEGLAVAVGRLSEQARALDVDLAVIATEPDRASRKALLAAQADRIALLSRACGQVRRGVLLSGSTTTAALLHAVVNDLNDEVIALGLRARAYADLATHPATRL